MMRVNVLAALVLGMLFIDAAGRSWAEPPAAGKTDLKLFEQGKTWKRGSVNGKATFELGKDGETPIGVLSFDFSGAAMGAGGRYVTAAVPVEIPATAGKIQIRARSATALPIGVRVIDDTDQVHQFKKKMATTDAWETIEIPLTKKTEHWGGAKDGVIHFPIKTLVLLVSHREDDPATGKVEFKEITTVAK